MPCSSHLLHESRRESRPRIWKPAGFFLLLLLLSVELAVAWENPSERYAKAYEKYTGAGCPLPADDGIRHFVYFARDREAIRGHRLLEEPRFVGAQVMYPWAVLEPSKGQYDFSVIEEDLKYLQARGKKLFVQLQDATFQTSFRATPDYLQSKRYGGGSVLQHTDDGVPEGWVAKRWHPLVQERFALLLAALGEAFDGRVEGINLQETAIGVSPETDDSFSFPAYAEAIRVNMHALKRAFPRSTTLQYANFMPGEWLPWDDEGYLRSIYRYGQEIGVGLGAPDLMVKRKGQLNHALAMMHEHDYAVPLGIAVQDGNYTGLTGADFAPGKEEEGMAQVLEGGAEGRVNLVPLLHAFAADFLEVDYIFWVDQEPYFEHDVLPCLAGD